MLLVDRRTASPVIIYKYTKIAITLAGVGLTRELKITLAGVGLTRELKIIIVVLVGGLVLWLPVMQLLFTNEGQYPNWRVMEAI